MANKKTRPLTKSEFDLIISTIKNGFVSIQGEKVRPNLRVATALVIETNLGIRIGDIVKLRLSDIVFEDDRWHLDIIEEKTHKKRTFTVPTEIVIYLQSYALEMGITQNQRLFAITVRTVQNHLKMACDVLGLKNIGSHSCRKTFAMNLYKNTKDLFLVQTVLNHSSPQITERYLSIEQAQITDALKNNVMLPA